jgi:hypothetical protein
MQQYPFNKPKTLILKKENEKDFKSFIRPLRQQLLRQ